MTHPPRFLRTILERPNDDSPRLRYANWLDGCGNPLGEFIRLQCLHAKNPDRICERREQELLARHQGDWSAELAGCVRWCSFRRGFIEEVALTDRQMVKHGRDVFARAPIRDVHLASEGHRLHALPALAGGESTFFLDLSSQRLGDDGVERLADAPMLAHVHGLNLSNVALCDDGLASLFASPHLTRLRELYVNDNPIHDDAIRRCAMSPALERLDWLDIRFTRITDESLCVLRRILGNKIRHGNTY